MRFAFRSLAGAALSLAMFSGDLATLSATPAPAAARDHYRGGHYGGGHGYRGGYRGYGHRHYRGGVGFGDVLLGAAIIGGVAAIASSANRSRIDDGYTTYQTYPPPVAYAPSPDGYGAYDREPQPYASTDPVEQCSRAAEREAQPRNGSARVIGIDRVDNRANGARVNGTLEIRGDSDRNGNARTERRSFDCTADYGQITGLRLG